MKTTTQWINEVISSSTKFDEWLQRQYIGEMLAAERITYLVELTADKPPYVRGLLNRIAKDERQHAEWIKVLLETRGIEIPEISYADTRYWKILFENGSELNWKQILKSLATDNFEELMGVGHHAEQMRLERITAISSEERFSPDVRDTFSKIYVDERKHVMMFATLSTQSAIDATTDSHERGLMYLGLEI